MGLREKRKEKKMTQQEVADAIGISRQAYFNIEKKRGNPKITTAQKLADLFEISLDELLRG